MNATCETAAHKIGNHDAIAEKLLELHNTFAGRRASHLGYPYNLEFDAEPISEFAKFLINNLGDPYVGSHYATEVCGLEREVVDWVMRVWDCADPEEYWGSVGASGTEGNLRAMYLARETLGDPILIHSTEAQFSPKGGENPPDRGFDVRGRRYWRHLSGCSAGGCSGKSPSLRHSRIDLWNDHERGVR